METGNSLLFAEFYLYAENQCRHGMDRLDYGRIHCIQSGNRLPYRVRGASIQTRPRHERGIYTLRSRCDYVRRRRTFGTAGHQKQKLKVKPPLSGRLFYL